MLLGYWFKGLLFQWSPSMPHDVVYVIARKMISMLALSIWFRKLNENEILAIVGNIHGHVASNPEDFEGQHDSMAMVEFNVAMIMTAGYTLFKKRASHPDTHDSGPAKT